MIPFNEAEAKYKLATFIQVLKRQAKIVFGQGYVVTRAQLYAAFLSVNPELEEDQEASFIFDMMYEAMLAELADYKIQVRA